jgi:hypothetical protein
MRQATNLTPPPAVPGLTEGIPRPDPLRMMAMMMSPEAGMTGAQHLTQAIDHLTQAGKVDPRLHSQIADALRVLMQGLLPDHDRDGEPESGPSLRGR